MVSPSLSGNVDSRRLANKDSAGADIFSSLSEEKKSRWILCESFPMWADFVVFEVAY